MEFDNEHIGKHRHFTPGCGLYLGRTLSALDSFPGFKSALWSVPNICGGNDVWE